MNSGGLIPVCTLPKNSFELTPGGIHGEDYHISPIGDDGLLADNNDFHLFNTMTPNNYGRTGESIDYKPTTGTSTVSKDITGETVDTTFETENLGWNIWGEDNDNIYLISKKPTQRILSLKGGIGCNNGVITQDNIAKECYYNSAYTNMTARTLKIEDIEYITYYDYNSYPNYNTRPTEITRGQLRYPAT